MSGISSRSSRIVRDNGFGLVHNEPATNEKLPEASATAAKADPAGADIRIIGLRVESSAQPANYDDNGVPELMSATPVRFRFFGSGFSSRTIVTLTEVKSIYGRACILPATGTFRVEEGSVKANTMIVEMQVPKGKTSYYFCTKNAEDDITTADVSGNR